MCLLSVKINIKSNNLKTFSREFYSFYLDIIRDILVALAFLLRYLCA